MNETFQNDSINSFVQLSSKQESFKKYDGHINYDSSNIFKVRKDGEISVCIKTISIYVELWDKSLDSPKRVFQLPNEMNCQITMINVDFERDFVVSGDCRGNLMIQRMSTNQILFKNTQFFEESYEPITCSSIMDDYLCVGSNNYMIGTVNLTTFTKINQLTFKYDSCVTSINLCRIKDQIFVIAATRYGK